MANRPILPLRLVAGLVAAPSTPSDHADVGVPRLARGLCFFLPIIAIGHLIGEPLRDHPIGVSAFFLPYAALTAALVLAPRRDWMAYIVVAVIVSFGADTPRLGLSRVLGAQVADVAEALTATMLLLRFFDGPPRLDGIATLLRFFVAAVILAPAIGAVLGATNIVMHDPSTSFGRSWIGWFLSNALTGLTMLPALLLVFPTEAGWHGRVDRRRLAESATIAGTLAAMCWVSLTLGSQAGSRLVLALYAPLPALIWVALRFGPGATCLAYTGVMFAAVIGADRSAGPFLGLPIDERILAVQLFVLLTSVPILCIAAISSARRAIVDLHQAVLASVHAHVAVLDARGAIMELNASWRRFAESPSAASYDRVQVGDNYLEACRRAAEAGDATALREADGITSVLSGTIRLFEMEYSPRQAGDGRYAMTVEALAPRTGGAFVRRLDITTQHRARVQVEEQRRQLTHLARVSALGQLSGALAHELSQPLSVILNNAETARRLLKGGDLHRDALDGILRDIVLANQRAAETLRRLRAMLKRGETRVQPLAIEELIRDVLDLAHADLLSRRVAEATTIPPDLPPLLGDRVQLQQVLLNLILNACEAMASTPERRLWLTATAARDEGIQISIRDTGSGIAPAVANRLFEPFVTTKPDGLGLGLSISRAIVASHGGRIWVDNNPQGGATAHCLLRSVRAGTSTA